MKLDALFFDGQTAEALAVQVFREGERLLVEKTDSTIAYPMHEIHVRPTVGRIPLQVELPDGGLLEIADYAGARAVLGISHHAVEHLEAYWRFALASVVLMLLVLGAGWYWGLPWAADKASAYVPVAWEKKLGQETIEMLDEHWFGPSSLSSARQNALREALATRLRQPQGCCELVFRDGKMIGANALAIPGGKLIVTDALVALAKNDEEILAVLAHELGHEDAHHSTRLLVRASGIGVIVALLAGDVSTFGNVLTTAPVVLMQLSYSRQFEDEADAYALQHMRAAGIPACRFTDILTRLAASSSHNTEIPEWLASHPDVARRTQAFGPGCGRTAASRL